MKRMYVAPMVEKIAFDYKVQTSGSTTTCFESVMNERPTDGNSTQCVGGTPTSFGWNDPQTLV